MHRSELRALLDGVARGLKPTADAEYELLEALRARPFEDLGFARVDHHRAIRHGFPEVVLGLGKTAAQIAAIAAEISSRGSSLLVTRATPEAYAAVRDVLSQAVYYADARVIVLPQGEVTPGKGTVATISEADVEDIAKIKMPDLNAIDEEGAMAQVAGTARSMGIEVVD